MQEINIIKNYISSDTAKFLYKTIGPNTVETPDPGVFGGFSKNQTEDHLKLGNPISEYTIDSNYNIAIDLVTMLATCIAKTISDKYGSKYFVRNIHYNKMVPGSKNKLHMDNYYLDSTTESFKGRPGFENDKSALLYLNNPNEYSGGEISFPLQNLMLKPEEGTLIFFEGSKLVPHEVFEIISGERHNVVIFLTDTPGSGKNTPPNSYPKERPITLNDLGQLSTFS